MNPNYSILRRDASEPGHTGIAVYVHDTIAYITCRRHDLESVHVKSIWLPSNQGGVHLFYQLFDIETLPPVWSSMMTLLAWWTEFKTISTVTIFYFLMISTSIFSNQTRRGHLPPPLFNLHQIVQTPTRVAATSATLIDDIYVNNRDRILHTYVPVTSVNEHYPVNCKISLRNEGRAHLVRFRVFPLVRC